jgi:threonine dehydrogenase-like Zn-dependent dehydrogenase
MGVVRIKELTNGIGADAVLEFDGVELNGEELFFSHVRLHGGPAPVRRFLPELIDLVWHGKINPGKVFDLTLPLDQVAEGYRAMDERRAI